MNKNVNNIINKDGHKTQHCIRSGVKTEYTTLYVLGTGIILKYSSNLRTQFLRVFHF